MHPYKKKYALVLREKRTKLVKRTQQIVTQNTDVHTVKPSKIKAWGERAPFYYPNWWYGAQSEDAVQGNTLNLQIGDIVLTAELADNSSVDALREMLSAGPLEIDMQDYGDMEKVGSLGQDLPVNDEQITTEAGDLILYQGNSFVIYYAPNTWNFTRLGKINGVSAEELQDILGEGDITVTLSLAE